MYTSTVGLELELHSTAAVWVRIRTGLVNIATSTGPTRVWVTCDFIACAMVCGEYHRVLFSGDKAISWTRYPVLFVWLFVHLTLRHLVSFYHCSVRARLTPPTAILHPFSSNVSSPFSSNVFSACDQNSQSDSTEEAMINTTKCEQHYDRLSNAQYTSRSIRST